MEDIVYFTTNGKTYAKGFFNQNGHSFYILPGYEGMFDRQVKHYLGPDVEFYFEVIPHLPGPDLCPPEVP